MNHPGIVLVNFTPRRHRRAVMEVQLEIVDLGDATRETRQASWPVETMDNMFQWGRWY